ncbi:hypothetical protein, partial [uncultured Altibacter sp.]
MMVLMFQKGFYAKLLKFVPQATNFREFATPHVGHRDFQKEYKQYHLYFSALRSLFITPKDQTPNC